MDDSSSRKRPRPVVSCLRCRDKKLKCDRTAPCENCVKASTANTCTYNRNGVSPAKVEQGHSTPSASSYAAIGSLEDLQARMAKVEELLGVARSHHTRAEKPAPATPLPLLGTVVVKGNRSVYHGQNDRVTLLNQVRILFENIGRSPLNSSTTNPFHEQCTDKISFSMSRISSMKCQMMSNFRLPPNK